VSPHNGCIHAFRFAFGLRFIVTAFGRDEGQSPRKIMTTFVNVTLQVPVDTDGKLLLPDNLCVGRDLYLRGEAITALPNNLSVPGDLYLYRTAVKALPEDLSIGGDLYLLGTAIKVLPKGAKVGGNIYGLEKSA
jgi:hypothetical protein